MNLYLSFKKYSKNFSFLTFAQLINVLIVFLLYPFFINKIGFYYLGIIAAVQSIFIIVEIVINFGIDNYSILKLSYSKNYKFNIEFLISTLIIKLLIYIIVLIIYYTFSMFVKINFNIKQIVFLCFIVSLLNILSFKWYFQINEKYKFFAISILIGRLLYVYLCYQNILKTTDFSNIVNNNILGLIVSNIFIFIYIVKTEYLFFCLPRIKLIYLIIAKSYNLFLSELITSIYSTINKIIISNSFGFNNSGFYDLIDKIISLFRSIPLGLVRSFTLPIYSKNKDELFLKKITIIMVTFSVFSIIFLLFFGKYLLKIICKDKIISDNLYSPLILSSLTIITTHLTNYYFTLGLWVANKIKLYRNILIFIVSLNLVLILFLRHLELLGLNSTILLNLSMDFILFYILTSRKYVYFKLF